MSRFTSLTIFVIAAISIGGVTPASIYGVDDSQVMLWPMQPQPKQPQQKQPQFKPPHRAYQPS